MYDVLILGGGPAGYTAALYVVRAGYKTAVIEKLSPGGQMNLTNIIENYPGFAEGIDGFSLGMAIQAGAEKFGAESLYDEAVRVDLTGAVKWVETASGEKYEARAVILATGADHRKLGIAGEAEFAGKGVGYCAHCDGMLYRGKEVVVIGGGESAVGDAIYLSGICPHVTLIHRRDRLRASKIAQAALLTRTNVTVLYDTVPVEIRGEGKVSGLVLKTGEEMKEIAAAGVFISIGRDPNTALFAGQVALDGGGYVMAGEDTVTSVPGVFAVGDLRTKPLRQVVTATADGAVAADRAAAYLV